MENKLKPPCNDCPGKNLSRGSAVCANCDDRVSYSKFIDNPTEFRKNYPNFQYTFEVLADLEKTFSPGTSGGTDEMKFCPRCEKDKPPSSFYKNKSQKSGLSSFCRMCTKEVNKKSTKKHNDKMKTERLKHEPPIEKEAITNNVDFINHLHIDVSSFPFLRKELEEISKKELRGSAETQALWFLTEAIKKYNE